MTDAERRRNFERWFASSKVVDATGAPLVVYHGTTGDGIQQQTRRPTFFSSHAQTANGYACGDAGQVQPVFLKILNPLEVDAKNGTSMSMPYQNLLVGMPYLLKEAKKSGHDGVIVRNIRDLVGEAEMTTFFVTLGNRDQIKSAIGNIGAFSGVDPDITDRAAAAHVARAWLHGLGEKAMPAHKG